MKISFDKPIYRFSSIIFALLGSLFITISLMLLIAQLVRAQNNAQIFCVVPPSTPIEPWEICEQSFHSIQTAVSSANPGSEIRMASGTYTELNELNGITQTVNIDKDVILTGGYEPPFDSSPNPTSNKTIIDPNQMGRAIVIENNAHVEINGLELINGHGSASPFNSQGGAIYAQNANLTLLNSTLSNNIAKIDGNGSGGAVYIENSTFHISNNAFFSNSAATKSFDLYMGPGMGFGGAIAIANSSGTIENNDIFSNTGSYIDGWGGGIIIDGHSFVTVTGNLIENNVASSDNLGNGGGLAVTSFDENAPLGEVTLSNNRIHKNTAVSQGITGLGGGLFIQTRNSIPSQTQNFILIDNDFIANGAIGTPSGNSAVSAGGALAINGLNQAIITNNRIMSNTAVVNPISLNTPSKGGGMYISQADTELFNNIVDANEAEEGAGIYSDMTSTLNVLNNVFINNHATLIGSSILAEDSQLNLNHATLSNNLGINDIYLRDNKSNASLSITNTIFVNQEFGIYAESASNVTAEAIMWFGVTEPISFEMGANVTTQNMMFDDPILLSDGYHIDESSPAIGVGLATKVELDIDFQQRNNPPTIGADEFWKSQITLPIIIRPDN